jgi:hypothetical protein
MTLVQTYSFDSAKQIVIGAKPKSVEDYRNLHQLLSSSVRGKGIRDQIFLILKKSFLISDSEASEITRFVLNLGDMPAEATLQFNVEEEARRQSIESSRLRSEETDREDRGPDFKT